ncbi:hypothetical protein [Algoriphagus ratkowskyi]|uniref:Uncharacterized protein n=1 Tax=Algoriphagus ratkowskyi TaxID=57028 RepID=A0ABY3HNS6_9BACT|nr:hypothetical protein [Algoriphagus ratkowskyi]TXD78034.1 hypothetical protein ESW18_08265 [Algoriphagus ratkowskyi]
MWKLTMITMVKCPNCSSDQVTAQKKGFSGGKALAGAVLAGPLGAIAGTHGSGKIKVFCLSCGHTWDPKAQASKEKSHADIIEMMWKKSVIKAYDSGNIEEARKLYLNNVPNTPDNFDLTLKMEKLRKEADTTGGVILLIIMGILFLILMIWLLN